MKDALPLLDETACTGCGDCVAACPTYCLEMAVGLPWMPRSADCISCAVCVLICPEQALTMSTEVFSHGLNTD